MPPKYNYIDRRDEYAKDNKYLPDKKSPLGEVLGGLLGITALAIGGVALFNRGNLKPVMSKMIKSLGDYSGSYPGAVSKAIRKWSKEAGEDASRSFLRTPFMEGIKNLGNAKVRNEMWAHTLTDVKNFKDEIGTAVKRLKDLRGKAIRTVDELGDHMSTDLFINMRNLDNMVGRVQKMTGTFGDSIPIEAPGEIRRKMEEELIKKFSVTAEEQAELIKKTGYRWLTVGDMFDSKGNVVNEQKLRQVIASNQYDSFTQGVKGWYGIEGGPKVRDLIFDKSILIKDEAKVLGEIANLKTFKGALGSGINTLANDFQIPFVGINPIKLFDLNRITRETPPLFSILEKGSIQSVITGNATPLKGDMFFINGNIFGYKEDSIGKMAYDFVNPIATNMVLESGNASGNSVARYLRKMAGISLREVKKPGMEEPIRKAWYEVAKILDVGFQDEAAEAFDVTKPYSYMSIIDRFLKGAGRPGEDVTEDVAKTLRNAFNTDGFIVLNKSTRLRDIRGLETVKDYFKQFFVGRDSVKKVTPLSLVPYAFMERLNSGLGAVGLGLRTENMKSAADIYKNLMLRRVLPVVGGIALWNYINYESEKMTGGSPEEEIADAYVNAKINFASFRDLTGITGLAKDVRKITPGSEQISEIPFNIFKDIDKSAEELEEYYIKGEDPVRKGRYWDLGNTPYTGGKVEYYRPNAYRRLKSDWQYTDSLYGSEDEYWRNYWLPTPRYPLAPVRHFITDNRWLEEKHYKDRPYLISEGINELEGIPIFGPIVDDTIGRILKPPKRMHEEYWDAIENPKGQRKQSQESITDTEFTSKEGKVNTTKVVLPGSGQNEDKHPVHYTEEQSNETGTDVVYSNTEEKGESTTLTYVTSSGRIQVVEAPGRVHVKDINRAIKGASLSKSVRGVQKKYTTARSQGIELPETMPPYDPTVAEVMVDISEMAGIYGFSATDLLGIYQPDNIPEMATPSDIDSMRDRFWELNIGGLGGELSEIGRRFIPRDKNKMNEFNPIKNTMPEYIPGDDYFLNLKRGDPYRIPYGEIRMPGEAFEKIEGLGDVMSLPARGSMMGYSKEEMLGYFFQENAVLSDYVIDAANEGDAIHTKLQRQWAKEGTLIDAEVEINNEEMNYTGHYDARVVDETSPAKESLVDIKSLSQKRWDELVKNGQPYEKHIGQINAYLNTIGLPKGYIYYVNRDNPEDEPLVFEMWYDAERYEKQKQTLREAREEALRLIESGEKSRGDLYDYFTRFKILADVAPYSNEFREYRALMSQIGLDEEQKKEVSEIIDQVQEQKKKVRMYDYKFATSNLKKETVTISKVVNNEMFMTEEYPDNPIRFAGIDVSTSKTSDEGKATTQFLSRYINPGMKVQIQYDIDEAKKYSKDTYRTIRSVVSSRGIKNLNRRLLDDGLAKEKENDWSPAGVRARFSPTEIEMGSMWEKVAHLDTVVNTKFLQVRSPREQYERRQIYSKDFQNWANPIRDFVVPGVEKLGGRSFVPAIFMGGIMGFLFGKSAYGKVVGTLAGASAGLVMQAISTGSELEDGSDNRWIPKRRRTEREINEYVDLLKYIKARKLYEEYAQSSLDKEHFDIKAYIKGKERQGEERQEELKRLEYTKRQLTYGNISVEEAEEKVDIKGSGDSKTLLKSINKKIKEVSEFREVNKLPPLATRALQYYLQSEQTLYGFDQGDSIQDAVAALPSKEREYFMAFLNAPEEEKGKILEVAPRYMRRMLQSSWGLPVEEKPDLVEYFSTHQLPSSSWEGWGEGSNMDVVKVKLVQHTNIDPTEFNVWPDDEERAGKSDIRAPQMNTRENAYRVKRKLEDLMHGSGFEDVRIDIEPAEHDRLDISMDIRNDKRREIEMWMNENGHSLLQ